MKATKSPGAVSERQNSSGIDRSPQDPASQIPASIADLRFDLALWARSLESFCAVSRQAFPNDTANSSGDRNYRNEFYITRLVLIRCAELIEELNGNISLLEYPFDPSVDEFRKAIKPLISCGGAITRAPAPSFAEWIGWSEIVAQRIASTELCKGFDLDFETFGRAFLSDRFIQFLESPILNAADRGDLQSCLPKLGGILRSLDVVGQMLARDAPLKSTLAIFAFVYEAAQEITFEMNERLSHRDDETSGIFAMFDAATYTLTIESKKVFNHELSSVIDTRSATAVFARVESACGLLNDNIRHLLAGFLRLTEPGIAAVDLFPEFNEKLEQSIRLRSDLWSVLSAVRKAETNSGEEMVELRDELAACLESSIAFLFYKDRETFERFCNEIIATPDGHDSGAILHRFSAYVETLFNEVGMRAVLVNHPFTPGE